MTWTFWPTFDEVAKFNIGDLLSGSICVSQTYDLFRGNCPSSEAKIWTTKKLVRSTLSRLGNFYVLAHLNTKRATLQ